MGQVTLASSHYLRVISCKYNGLFKYDIPICSFCCIIFASPSIWGLHCFNEKGHRDATCSLFVPKALDVYIRYWFLSISLLLINHQSIEYCWSKLKRIRSPQEWENITIRLSLSSDVWFSSLVGASTPTWIVCIGSTRYDWKEGIIVGYFILSVTRRL